MRDKKQNLRVILKLMTLMAVLLSGYMLLKGVFVSEHQTASENEFLIDIGQLKTGDYRYVNAGQRRLILVHRSAAMILALGEDPLSHPAYLLVYAQDPFYGCEVKYQPQQHHFKSVCVASRFDLAGRPLKGARTEMNLRLVDFELLVEGGLLVRFN